MGALVVCDRHQGTAACCRLPERAPRSRRTSRRPKSKGSWLGPLRAAPRIDVRTCAGLRSFKLELDFPNVDQWSQFVNVRVAVVVQGIEGMDVQRGRGCLRREGVWRV